MSKTYFDTTPLIYFLDDEKPFSDKVAAPSKNYPVPLREQSLPLELT